VEDVKTSSPETGLAREAKGKNGAREGSGKHGENREQHKHSAFITNVKT
jgi:hypothetical protein